MQDPTNGHGPPMMAAVFGFAALVADDAGRLVALGVGCGGLAISVIRLACDLQDRRERRADQRADRRQDRADRREDLRADRRADLADGTHRRRNPDQP